MIFGRLLLLGGLVLVLDVRIGWPVSSPMSEWLSCREVVVDWCVSVFPLCCCHMGRGSTACAAILTAARACRSVGLAYNGVDCPACVLYRVTLPWPLELTVTRCLLWETSGGCRNAFYPPFLSTLLVLYPLHYSPLCLQCLYASVSSVVTSGAFQ